MVAQDKFRSFQHITESLDSTIPCQFPKAQFLHQNRIGYRSWNHLHYLHLSSQPRMKEFFTNVTVYGRLYESFVAACAENFNSPLWTAERNKGFSSLLAFKCQYFPISLQSKYNALLFSFSSTERVLRNISTHLHNVISHRAVGAGCSVLNFLLCFSVKHPLQ